MNRRIAGRTLVGSLFFWGILAAMAPAQPPLLHFDEPGFHFGTVMEGDRVRHEFSCRNLGGAPVVISEVKPSCGCTVAEFSTEPIQPGEERTVVVFFNSKGRSGAQKKRVIVRSNDPDHPAIELELEGAVTPLLRFDPSTRIDLGRVLPDSVPGTRSVRMTWPKDFPLDVESVRAENPAMDVRFEPFETDDERGIAIVLRFPPAADLQHLADSNRIFEKIRIETSHPEWKTKILTVQGELASGFQRPDAGDGR